MDFGLESSQLVHPFSSQREFALRIVACEPTPHCAVPPLKTGPKRHTNFEVSVRLSMDFYYDLDMNVPVNIDNWGV